MFDGSGNLWVVTDTSSSKLGGGIYKSFKNNGSFVLPANAGGGITGSDVYQFASGPVEAELTGPAFPRTARRSPSPSSIPARSPRAWITRRAPGPTASAEVLGARHNGLVPAGPTPAQVPFFPGGSGPRPPGVFAAFSLMYRSFSSTLVRSLR